MDETDGAITNILLTEIFLVCRYLIHDRATLFTGEFQTILERVRVKSVRLSARSADLNVFA